MKLNVIKLGGKISYSFTRFGYNSKHDNQGWNIVISLSSINE